MLSSLASAGDSMPIFQIGEPYNLLRSTDAAAVKEHLMITVFGKGQYGVVTIVFPDLLFYFFVFAFLRSPGTIPHRLPNRPQ